ncbi:MAG TPA: hypothetical protein VJC07_04425 [Candidatus Nanoarchaeia archaeon]|nr:hypothetical protein [Candidatus Nanoarchaeia archaeon]
MAKMKATSLARLDRFARLFATRLHPQLVVSQYSKGRLDFIARLKEEIVEESHVPSDNLSRVLWGIRFRSPILNAAGMFKNGECYEIVARQGAGAYLGGTGTWNSRGGNEKHGVHLPFTPYPRSHAASNWLGLPNDGDEINSLVASGFERLAGTPVGWSVMGSPDLSGDEKLEFLIRGMKHYEAAGVDFLEMNESCPNTAHVKPQDDDMARRLRYVKERFLDERTRRIPVIVKFSNDTPVEQVPQLLDLLFELGYDGVNFGNTSTDYAARAKSIHPAERRLYEFFTRVFKGGISGRPLRESSLALAGVAADYLREGRSSQEFHVIRTGGIETLADIRDSESAGVSLNQWYTGYFENFAKHGHAVYRRLLE